MARNRRRWTLIAGGSVIAAFVSMAAVAAANLSSHSKSADIAPGQNGSVTAACPSGSEAVSGGFASPGFDPKQMGPADLAFTSRRVKGDRWRAQGYNFSNSVSGSLLAYAYCDKHEPGLAVESKVETIQPGVIGTATASCPAGTEAVSGGFESPKGGPDAHTLFAYASKRVGDRKWSVSVVPNQITDPLKLKAFAYCDERRLGLVSRSTTGTVAPGDKLSLTVDCPNRAKAFSGGYDSTIDTSGGVMTGFAFTSRRDSDSAWKVSAFGNAGGATPSTETAIVYCKR